MASLATLGAIPELLYGVLQHLEPRDTVSLLRTSKIFYPICHKHLWTDLWLFEGSQSPRFGCLWGNNVCRKIYGTLCRYGVEGCGLKHTRSLRLHRRSLDESNEFVQTGLIFEFGRLLSAGSLDLDCVELFYDDGEYCNQQSPQRAKFLAHIAEHSIRKGPENFSFIVTIALDPEALDTILNDLPVERITDLCLELNWTLGRYRSDSEIHNAYDRGYNSDDPDYNDDYRNSDASSDHHDIYTEYEENDSQETLAIALAEILNQAVNLKYLAIETARDSSEFRFRDPRHLKELEILRNTIKSMPKLQSLEIIGEFFHPSFFVTPPPTTKRVVYDGLFSHRWFRKFARCSFTNVKDLVVIWRWDGLRQQWCRRDFARHPQFVADVRFCGLQTCQFSGFEGVVLGVEQAVIKRNPGLDKASKIRLSYPVVERLGNAAGAKLITASTNFLNLVPNDSEVRGNIEKGEEEKKIEVTKTVQECLQSMPKNLENLEARRVARDRAQELSDECRNRIQNLFSNIESQFVSAYTQKILDRSADEEQVDMKMASKDYLKILIEAMEGGDAWTSKRAQADNFLERCRDKMKEEVDACTKHWAGERAMDLIFQVDTDDQWIEKFTQECAEKLSLR
ncbi:hypothetical protein TWF281_000938 [Arthrobotrys megalospora]